MKMKISHEDGNIKLEIDTKDPMEWEIVRSLFQMADPIAMTTFLKDKGFVTTGDEVADFLDEFDRKSEEFQ